jgi:SAM-dependent methyltransferase
MEHDHGHHGHHHTATESDEAAMAELLDLDAEVLHAYGSEVSDWIGQQAAGLDPRRIVDLGSGTGTGTLALLRRFERANVIAVDVSGPMLDRLRGKADALGVAGRVRTVQADLDAGWPAVGPVDMAWASGSLHHLADPARVLAEVLAALRPGGLLIVAEIDSFPRFLPDDIGLGRPGLEARCHAVLSEDRAARLPHLGSDWPARLAGAGFVVEAERSFVIELSPPLPASAGQYAEVSLRRARSGLDGRMDPADLAVLDTLLGDGPDGLRQRGDLTVRTARTVWAARRPQHGG